MTSGEELRDGGMALVLANAPPSWRAGYARLAANWFATLPVGAMFTGEDMHLHALEHGLGEPHHPNAWSAQWGSYVRALLKCGMAESVAMGKMTRPSAHARQNPTYRKIR